MHTYTTRGIEFLLGISLIIIRRFLRSAQAKGGWEAGYLYDPGINAENKQKFVVTLFYGQLLLSVVYVLCRGL